MAYRVFEKNKSGLLKEIDPSKAEEAMKDKMVSAVSLGTIYVIMTPEEEKQHKKTVNESIARKKQHAALKAKREADLKAIEEEKSRANKELMAKIRELQERLDTLEKEKRGN